jgi:excisionase family DNA binding protein
MPFGPPKPAKQETNNLLTPGEVARLFRVDTTTVRRWAELGKITAVRTIGGQRRYNADEILALLNGTAEEKKENTDGE